MRALISALEERLDEPTAKGLAHAVSRAVRDGVLTSGDRLPPIRELARQLMLSPTTVSAAWQLLSRAGTIHSAGRRGTTIADLTPQGGRRYARALRHESEVSLDLSTGVPDGDLLPDLGPALAGLTALAPGSYLDDPVLDTLREVLLADWPYPPEDLIIVDGALDALDHVVRTLLHPGDLVLVEDPAFPPLLDLLEARDVEVRGIPLDEAGMDLVALTAALDQGPAAVFIQPRGHNPTGISMSPTRARLLAEALSDTDTLVVEDDSGGHVATSQALSLGQLIPHQVIHIRSFSKSHGPDLRLAAMSGPSTLLATVRQTRALGQGWTSRLLQRVLATLLTDPFACQQVERAKGEYAVRRDRVTRRLHERGIEVGGTDGLNIWVPVLDEAAALLRLATVGIAVTPGSPFTVEDHRGHSGPSGPSGHIRVTCGLIRTDHDRIADLIADAATVGAWTAQHR